MEGLSLIIHSIAGLILKTQYKDDEIFPKPREHSGGNVKVELDLSMPRRPV